MKRIVLAITGASGSAYGIRTLECLLSADREVHFVVSPMAERVILHETGATLDQHLTGILAAAPEGGSLVRHRYDDLFASVASGSFATEGMIVAPCSMATVAEIASGYAHSLVVRAADVALKERRTLVVVPRETPLSSIHLSNMLKVTEAGGVVLPAMPAFYHRPTHIRDLVDFVVSRILNVFGIEHSLISEWSDDSIEPEE
ncbi:UbiX family flavin prenyltransferase [Salinispira pacifica]